MMRRTLSLFFLFALLLVPLSAVAKLCGDDVNGQDVPCACGDVVASDVVLGSDPVTHTICDGDGLIVRAMDATHGVTVDLHGSTLHGTGSGAGVFILYGGPGGAHVVSSNGPATLQGFRDGVFAHGADAVALVDGVIALNSRRDGMRLDTGAYEIRNSEAQGSGRDGFSVSGRGYRLNATRATNSKRYGYFVMGSYAALGTKGAGLIADDSGEAGFDLNGMGHELQDCVARRSHGNGVHLNGMHYDIRGCTVSDNSGDGIGGAGESSVLADNQAVNNEKNGILVDGVHAQDLGGNGGSGNLGLHQQTPVWQCKIGRQPCEP